jgi:hypothetical protein
MSEDATVLAARLIAQEFIAGRITAAAKETRERIRGVWAVGKREPVELAAGPDSSVPVNVGNVRVDKGTSIVSVTDTAELVAWLQENDPESVEVYQPEPVTRVKPNVLTVLLDNAKKNGAAVTDKGELIPGIDVRVGPPKVVVTGAKTVDQQAAVMAAILESGAVGSLLALPAGEDQ